MNQLASKRDTQLSLQAHAVAKGEQIRAAYGPNLGWNELHQLVQDRALVRYPTEIAFDADSLLPGELAYPLPKGQRPEDGFRMCVHPLLADHPEQIAWVVLYQLVQVNYGPFAGPDDAEAFGASALGISKDDYYQKLCHLADSLHP